MNKCITGFTPEQLEYACNIFERFRIFQDNTEFCFVDVIVEWNDNPNPVKVHVENNGVYRLEVDGEDYSANERAVVPSELYNGPGSVTIEDTSGNGFSGGRVIIEVLEDGSAGSSRTTVLEFDGGSFSEFGTETYSVVSETCLVQ